MSTWSTPNKYGHACLLVRRELKAALNEISLTCRIVILVTSKSPSRRKSIMHFLNDGVIYDSVVTLRGESQFFNVKRIHNMYPRSQSYLYLTWVSRNESNLTKENFGPIPYALQEDELLVLAMP
jgi:hypothetical protein